MNILIDLVPTTVLIDNMEYEINSNFRESILFELLMQDNTILEEEKSIMALNLYYNKIPHDINEAVRQMLWFYKCGKLEEDSHSEGNKGINNNGKVKQIYSYEHDADYIYTAFLTQYGIDLQDIDYLHWWKFKAMFKSLKEDNQLSKIMGYRSMKIDSNMSKEEKKYYREMKKLYALPDNRTEEEKEADFHNSLASIV